MIDASIYQNIQTPKVDTNAGASMASDAMNLADLGMRHQQMRFQQEQTNAVRQAYQKNTGQDGAVDRKGMLADLGKMGHAQAGQGIAQQWAAQDKAMADTRASQIDAAQKAVGIVYPGLEYVAGAPESQRKQAYSAMMQNLERQGVDTSKMPKDYEAPMFRSMYDIASKQKPVLEQTLAQANIGHVDAETAKIYSEIGKEKRKPLAAEQSDRLAGHDAGFKQLDDLEAAIKANSDIMGPVAGRTRGLIPGSETNTRAKSLQALVNTAAQKIGKSLEGGKLTDADIERYRGMLPTNTDAPELALQKIEQVRRMVAQQQASDIDTYGKAGINVAEFSARTPNDISITKRPKGGKKDTVNSAVAADLPKQGAVQDGYVFLGGNPSDSKSWKKAR